MSNKTIKRLFLVVLLLLVCGILISYRQANSTSNSECSGSEKCEQKKAQTDLILLESLTKRLLSATEN
jgi:hypothetical protein